MLLNKIKMKQKDCLLLFFLFIVYTSFIIEEINNLEIKRIKNNELSKLKQKFENKQINNFKFDFKNLKDKAIYWKGWIKYFHYSESKSIKKPKSFFQNNIYYRQRIKHTERLQKDKYGMINIPSNIHYFAIIQKDKLNVLASRSDEIPTIIDTLNYQFIRPIPIERPTKGGINDLGNFPEGKCIKVSTNIPNKYRRDFNPSMKGHREAWILCTDSTKDKMKILNYLIRLTVKIQQSNGLTFKSNKKLLNANKETLSQLIYPKKKIDIKRNKGHKDGYWVLIQDWTQCTLKCGGGKKYQQWMCAKPEKGGKPCVGEAIKVQNCNMHPCPNIMTKQHINKNGESEESDEIGNTNITLKPIIKMVPFSTRPQRYSKCIIKENDAMLVLKNYKHTLPTKGTEDMSKIPIRVVMNNSTISAFQDENYHSNIFTINIKETVFLKDEKEKCCFKLRWRKSEYRLCGFEIDCQLIKQTTTKFVNDWSIQFNLFKNQCGTKRDIFSFGSMKPKFNSKTGKITFESNASSQGQRGIPGGFSSETTSSLSSTIEFDSNGKIKEGSVSLPLTRNDQIDFQNTLVNLVENTRNKLVEKKSKMIEDKLSNFEEESLHQKVRRTQSIALNAIKRELELEELVQKEEKAKEDQDTQSIMKEIIMEKRKELCLNKAMKQKEQESQINKEKAQAVTEIERIKTEALKTLKKKRNLLKKKIMEMRRVAQRKKAVLKFQLIRLRQRMAKKIVNSNHRGNMFLCPQGRDDPVKRNDYCEYHFSEDYPKFLECKNDYDFCFLCCETEYGNLFPQKREECYKLCDKK